MKGRMLRNSAALTLAGMLWATAPAAVNGQEALLYPSGHLILLSGGNGPGAFQWQKDWAALNDDGRIEGAQTPVLRIRHSVYEDAGDYTLLRTETLLTTNLVELDGELKPVISTNSQVWTNAMFTIYVQDPPRILNFYHYTSGDNVRFNVEATGGGLAYQWYWHDLPIPGATSSELKYDNAQRTANAGYYSVRVTNLVGEAYSPPPGLLFLKAAPQGTYQGLFYQKDEPDLASSGKLQFTISGAKGAYAGKLNLLNLVYTFSGTFDDQHRSTVTATSKKGGASLTLTLQLTTLSNSPAFFGEVSDGNWTSPMRGHRWAYDSSLNPSPYAGQYTLAMLNTNLSGPGLVPNGNSIASSTIGYGGAVRVVGRVADGTAFTHASELSDAGEWPLYVPLLKGRAALFGWMTMEAGENGGMAKEPLYWIKSAGPDQFYPDGFSLPLEAIGSSYQPGVALPVDEGVAALTAGDMFTNELTVWNFYRVWQRDLNKWSAEKSPAGLELSIQSTRGFITGGFNNYMTGQRSKIRAVVLQEQGGALGYFLSMDSSGYFSITSGSGQ